MRLVDGRLLGLCRALCVLLVLLRPRHTLDAALVLQIDRAALFRMYLLRSDRRIAESRTLDASRAVGRRLNQVGSARQPVDDMIQHTGERMRGTSASGMAWTKHTVRTRRRQQVLTRAQCVGQLLQLLRTQIAAQQIEPVLLLRQMLVCTPTAMTAVTNE